MAKCEFVFVHVDSLGKPEPHALWKFDQIDLGELLTEESIMMSRFYTHENGMSIPDKEHRIITEGDPR